LSERGSPSGKKHYLAQLRVNASRIRGILGGQKVSLEGGHPGLGAKTSERILVIAWKKAKREGTVNVPNELN